MAKNISTIIDPDFLVIDLFCGAGGTTTGFVMSEKAIVIACINHDHMAIKSHWENNPEVEHFEEDITKLYGYLKYGVFFKSSEFKRLERLVELYRAFYPEAKLIIWASLECTNFSNAKGGKEKDADSRTLADHLKFYINPLSPEIIQIENVVEFMSWGPLDDKNKPISKKKGEDWLRWRKEICAIGYVDDWKELNSADFGAFTSRNRLFGIFSIDQQYICWPHPTHSKKPSTGNLFTPLKKWNAVREVLTLEDEGNSIFNRETNLNLRPQDRKNLSTNTIKRLYEGTVKHVIGEKPEFSVNESYQTSNFLNQYHGNGKTYSISRPSTTLSTKDRLSLVHAKYFMDYQFSNGQKNKSIDQPSGAFTKVPKQSVVKVDPWLFNGQFNNIGQSINKPAPVITSDRHQHYIVNPAWGGHSKSIEDPCCVIVARQDKAPLYLISCEINKVAIPVYENDCDWTVKLKELMIAYGISDIKMRMLRINEMKLIQGFPEDYLLLGSKQDQKKFIGNSVVPLVVKNWTEAISNNIRKTSTLN